MAEDALPGAQRLLETIELAESALEQRPDGAGEVPTDKVDEEAESVYKVVTFLYPKLPEIPSQVSLTNSTSAMLGSAILTLAQDISDRLQTPESHRYQAQFIAAYQRLQEAQQRPKEVRALLEKYFPKVVERFDIASRAYQGYKSALTDSAPAANEIRIFLTGLNGELMERARQYPREQKLPPCVIVERLFASASNKTDVEKQLNTEYQALFDALSNTLKRRPSPQTPDLAGLWERVLDHAFVVGTGLTGG